MLEVGDEALDLLTVKDVAKRLRVSVATVWRLVYSRELDSVIVGARSRRIAPEAVIAYKQRLAEQAKQGAA